MPSVLYAFHSEHEAHQQFIDAITSKEEQTEWYMTAEEYLSAIFTQCTVELSAPIFRADDKVFALPGDSVLVTVAINEQGELDGFRVVNNHGEAVLATESDLRGLRLI